MASRPCSKQGLQAISMAIQPRTTPAIAITALVIAPISRLISMYVLSDSAIMNRILVFCAKFSVGSSTVKKGNGLD